jgi:oligoendopeptidase F
MLQRDPEKFRTGYIALLKNGFDASPQQLLKKFLSIDMEDPALLEKSLSLVSSRVEQLRGVYRNTPQLRNQQTRREQPTNPQ